MNNFSLAKFSVKQPILVNLVTVLVIVAGLLTVFSMNKEVFPKFNLDMVSVLTIYPGISPEEMERLITIPLEEQLTGIDGIEKVESVSIEGRSNIIVYLDPDVENTYKVYQKIKDEIQKKEPELPEDANTPVVEEIKSNMPVITVAVSGNIPEHRLNEIVEDVEDKLLNLSDELRSLRSSEKKSFKNLLFKPHAMNISSIATAGKREREVWVAVDPHIAEKYSLSLQDVINTIRNKHISIPAGTMKTGKNEYTLRTKGEFQDINGLKNVIVKSSPSGGIIRLKDISKVTDTFEEPLTLVRVNGKKAMTLTVFKNEKGDAIHIVDSIREFITLYKSRLPEGVAITLNNDSTVYIKNRLNTVLTSAKIGSVIILVMLLLFMNWRVSLLTALGIPFSFCIAFLIMDLAGMTIHMLSLFSFIVVLGMIVDDAIIVNENIFRYMETGLEREDAVIKGANEVFWPVISATATTISAFIPMLLMTGMMGKYMSVIPKVVSIALLASLMECFFILPSHMAEFARVNLESRARKMRENAIGGMVKFYEKILRGAVMRRYISFGVILLVTLVTLVVAKNMKFVLFSLKEIQMFNINIETPKGVPIEETMNVLERIEKIVLREVTPVELEAINGQAGSTFNGHYFEYGSNKGQLIVELTDPEKRERSGDDILNAVREKVQDVQGADKISLERQVGGPPVGKPVFVSVRGKDIKTLRKLSKKLQDYLHSLKGIYDISDDDQAGKDELQVVVDEKKSAIQGVDNLTVGQEVHAGFGGGLSTVWRVGTKEIDVLVKFPEKFRKTPANLLNLRVRSKNGSMVPVSSIASVRNIRSNLQILRYNRRRTITVSASVKEDIITSTEANSMVKKFSKNLLKDYPGNQLIFRGEFEEQQKSVKSLLKAFFIGISLIYIILAVLFQSFIQPIVVMFSIPFSFIGVIFALLIAGEPLSLLAMIGIVALAGIVVNDSLVLVDFINQERKKGTELYDAIIRSGIVRFRPIILTSVTTIGGLLPMAMGWGAKGVEGFLSPMALAIVGGLFSSTILTLLVIPCIYYISEDLKSLCDRYCPTAAKNFFK